MNSDMSQVSLERPAGERRTAQVLKRLTTRPFAMRESGQRISVSPGAVNQK